ncbi:MAG: TetR/AcrR family transcriptional regulator [Caulobacteraceae bacterium]
MIEDPPANPKAEARRQQILDAACNCVRQAGFHGASMAEIAQAADLSVGQIYRYFENKEAIIAAIVAQDHAAMREKFARLEASGRCLAEAVISECSQAVEHNYDPERAALVLEVLAEAARNPRVAAIVRAADANERALVCKLLEPLSPSDRCEAEMTARGEVLMMLFDGMIMRSVNHPEGDKVAIADVMRSVIRHLLSDQPLLKGEVGETVKIADPS